MKVSIDELKIIAETDVPPCRRKTAWDEIFNSLPVGKAFVISESIVSYASVHQALAKRQKRGEFAGFYIVKSGPNTYLVNPKEKEASEE